MKNYRVSMTFTLLPDGPLDEFTTTSISCLSESTAFPNLPVSTAALGLLQNTFRNAITAAALGGKHATAVKSAARQDLLTALRKNAAYVQSVANQDRALLLSSGYDVASTNRAPAPLPKPIVLRVQNEASTTLTVRLDAVPNARTYEGRMMTATGTWQPIGLFNQARRILVTNLIPGTNYTLQFRAVGGSTGYSDWSDSITHMAT